MQATGFRYQERLSIVFNYIQGNLDRALTLDEVAAVACMSCYHFHRIFRAYTGESLHGHIRRLRLEKSAKLLRYGRAPISVIGLECGFDTPSSFSKAFRQHFAVSPAEFRRSRHMEIVAETRMPLISSPLQPEFITMPTLKICYVRRYGRYDQAATGAWQALMQYAYRHSLMHEDAMSLAITYDDPDITHEDHIRYEACLSLRTARKPDGEVGVRDIEGGLYAVFHHIGPYQTLWATYRKIYCDWLFSHDVPLRHAPEFSVYLNHHACKDDQSDQRTAIYVPVERA